MAAKHEFSIAFYANPLKLAICKELLIYKKNRVEEFFFLISKWPINQENLCLATNLILSTILLFFCSNLFFNFFNYVFKLQDGFP
jgi:hypothetical protein